MAASKWSRLDHGDGLSVELWIRPNIFAPIAHLVGDGGGGVESFRVQLRDGKVVLLLASGDGANAQPIITSKSSNSGAACIGNPHLRERTESHRSRGTMRAEAGVREIRLPATAAGDERSFDLYGAHGCVR